MAVPSGVRRRPVAVVVVAQLLGTSLWFSANSAADDLRPYARELVESLRA